MMHLLQGNAAIEGDLLIAGSYARVTRGGSGAPGAVSTALLVVTGVRHCCSSRVANQRAGVGACCLPPSLLADLHGVAGHLPGTKGTMLLGSPVVSLMMLLLLVKAPMPGEVGKESKQSCCSQLPMLITATGPATC